MASKTQIDKAGKILAQASSIETEEQLEAELAFYEYRKSHLRPLSEMTSTVQSWLNRFDSNYYIAQRLKRKPQILRKQRSYARA